jgi:hypothetical protein
MFKRTSSKCKTLITVFAASIGLVGSPAPVSAGLFSATGNIIAILSDDLFVGEAEGHLNGSGTLAIRSQKNPGLICRGEFTSSAEQGGTGKLACSDGTTATFSFQRLSVYRGHGVASFSRGTMNFAYGLAADEAAPYLKLPAGKKLKHDGTQLALVDK